MKFNKAIVSSLTEKFTSYTIENIISITYVKGVINIVAIDKKTMELSNYTYNNDEYDILINIG